MEGTVSIPRYPSDVTPEWLSAALSGHGAPVQVSAVDVAAIGTGQTGATYRVTAEYAADPGGLPQTFVIKLPAQDDTVRERVVVGYRSECAFYATVADRVRVPTPQCFYCEITEDAKDYALLLADQAPAVQGDQIAGCGEQEARAGGRRGGRLTRAQLVRSRLAGFPGIAFGPVRTRLRPTASVKWPKMSADITLDKLGDRMSADDRETFTTAMGLVTPWLLAERDRFALLHGDYRLDNMLFDPDLTRVSVVDWQTLGVGLPGKGSRVFHRDQPRSAAARGDRERPRRRVSPSPVGLRGHRL